jgi:hypothetical protein
MTIDIPHFNTNTTDINKTVIEKNISQFENKKSIEQEKNYVQDILWNKVIKE